MTMSTGEDLFGISFGKGDIIFRQGDQGDTMFIIQSGSAKKIPFPPDQQINFVGYDGDPAKDAFCVYDRDGKPTLSFSRAEFLDNVSELRAEWTLAKFPYLTRFGFPAGIMLVGPLSRSFQENGFLYDQDLSGLDLVVMLRDRNS